MKTSDRESGTIWSHAKVYALGSIINRAAGILLIPLYTHILDPAEFGVYALVVATGELGAIVLSGAISTAMVRCYLEKEDTGYRAVIASTTFSGFVIIAGSITVVAPWISDWASLWLFDTIQWSTVFLLAIISSIFSLLLDLEMNYYRARKMPWVFFNLSVGKALLMIALNLYFVAYLQMGVHGVVYGTCLAFGLISIPLLARLFMQLGIHMPWWAVRSLLHLGSPLIPGKAADLTTQFIDRYLLNLFIGSAAVGVYTLAQKLASLLQSFVVAPFAQIWIVRRLETLDAETDQQPFAQIFSFFLAVLTAAGLAVSLYSPEMIAVISDEDYSSAAAIVPLMVLTFILMPVDMNFQLGILHAYKSRFMMWSSIGAALVNAVSMYLLIPPYGVLGAAVAMNISNLARITFTYFLGVKFCNSKVLFDARAALILVLGAMAICLVTFAVAGYTISMPIMLAKAMLLVGYSIFAFMIVVRSGERLPCLRKIAAGVIPIQINR